MYRFGIWAGLLIALAPASAFASTSYAYTGTVFVTFQSPYVATDRVSGNFTLAAPLPANLPPTDISAQLLSYSFSDGFQTRTQANSQICASNLYGFRVSTDANGNIATWAITLCSPVTSVGDHLSSISTIHGFATATDEDVGIGDGLCAALESGVCSQINVTAWAYVYNGNNPSFWTPQAPADCQAMAGVWGNVSIAPGTPPDVRTWVFVPGDVVTLSVQLTSGTSAYVSIVGSTAGTPVYGGPVSGGPFGAPNSVSFQPPAGPVSLGYAYNAGAGLGLLSLTCASASAPVTGPQPPDAAGVPVMGGWAVAALAMTVGALGLAALRTRSKRTRIAPP